MQYEIRCLLENEVCKLRIHGRRRNNVIVSYLILRRPLKLTDSLQPTPPPLSSMIRAFVVAPALTGFRWKTGPKDKTWGSATADLCQGHFSCFSLIPFSDRLRKPAPFLIRRGKSQPEHEYRKNLILRHASVANRRSYSHPHLRHETFFRSDSFAVELLASTLGGKMIRRCRCPSIELQASPQTPHPLFHGETEATLCDPRKPSRVCLRDSVLPSARPWNLWGCDGRLWGV